jgi:regulator of protease activity HflC (stomatin/prohibitin superfamily)
MVEGEEEVSRMEKYEEKGDYTSASSVVPLIIALLIVLPILYLAWQDVLAKAGVSALTKIIAAVIVFYLVSIAIKINAQWEQAVILRLGRYTRTAGPGLFLIIPLVEVAIRRDMRIRTTTFVAEEALTKDNVPVNVDAVLFWEIQDAKKSAIAIQDYLNSITRAAMTTMRDVIGQSELAKLLSDRMSLDRIMQALIDKKAVKWGLNVDSVEIREVRIPGPLQDVMSRQAQAERERLARITLADSEIQIAKKFSEAAKEYERDPNAMRLRAMNMLYESVKERGTYIIVPSDVVNTMGFSGALATTALAEASKKKKKEEKD